MSHQEASTFDQRLPLCRRYLAIATGIDVFLVEGRGPELSRAVHWAIGFLRDGQCQALGVLAPIDSSAANGSELVRELRLRGVERVHMVLHEYTGHFAPPGVHGLLARHVVPSMASLVEQLPASVGPRARRPLREAMCSVLAADSASAAKAVLDQVSANRVGLRHPAVMAAWRDVLPHLAPFFRLPTDLRKLTLLGDSATQNLRRSLARSIRRHGAFASRQAALAFIRRRLERAELEFNLGRPRQLPISHPRTRPAQPAGSPGVTTPCSQ